MKQFIFATAVLMSAIVGAGVFALPYTGAQSGFLIGAIFLFILTGIMVLIHLLYGEIVSRTREKHRLVGYTGHYLGKWWEGVVGFSLIGGFYGSMLVYILMGGGFLYTMFSSLIDIAPSVFNLIFFAIGAIAIYFGLRLISELDLLMGIFLILIVFLFLYFGFSQIDIDNLKTVNWRSAILPYGAILYALAGFAAIPELKEIFSKKAKHYKKAIIWGTMIPAVLYLIFMFSVIGLTGMDSSPEAIEGLIGLLGRRIVFWGALFGFLATITSFFILGLSLKKVFWYDFRINKNLAWLLTCSVPLILFLLGIRKFIPIIVVLGAFLVALQAVVIVLIYKKAKTFGDRTPEYSLRVPAILRYIVILIFILGLVSTLISML